MIGAKEVIKCECEHLIHSMSPSPTPSPARYRPVGQEQGKDQIDPQAPSQGGCEQHLIHGGKQRPEPRLETQGLTEPATMPVPEGPDMPAPWGERPGRSGPRPCPAPRWSWAGEDPYSIGIGQGGRATAGTSLLPGDKATRRWVGGGRISQRSAGRSVILKDKARIRD